MSSGDVTLMDDILEVNEECVEDSREDDVVHLPPVGKGRGNGIGGDMVIEGIAVQN
jgi:hypothetical protein